MQTDMNQKNNVKDNVDVSKIKMSVQWRWILVPAWAGLGSFIMILEEKNVNTLLMVDVKEMGIG